MERSEITLRDRIEKLLEAHSLVQILEYNDATEEDILVFLYQTYGLKFPESEPL